MSESASRPIDPSDRQLEKREADILNTAVTVEASERGGNILNFSIGVGNETETFSVIDLRGEPFKAGKDQTTHEDLFLYEEEDARFAVVQHSTFSVATSDLAGIKMLRSQEELTIGREPSTKKLAERFKNMGDSVSRSHVTISESDGKIVVEDHSTNGTHVRATNGMKIESAPAQEAHEVSPWAPEVAKKGGDVAVREVVERPDMITHFPSSEELAVQKAARQAETEAKLDGQRAELQSQMREIQDQYPKEVGMNIWRYASGMLNKAKAQKEGNGQESTNQGQIAGQARRALKPVQQEAADRYLSLMRKSEKLG